MKDKILLINPDYGLDGPNFPWGILTIASYLRGKGVENICLLDASYYSRPEFEEILDRELPQTFIVGIGFMSPDSYFVKQLIDKIKQERKDCKIIVGGSHPNLYPEQTIQYKKIDFLAYGEGEETFWKLCKYLLKREGRLEEVPGLMYLKGDRTVKTPPAPQIGFYDIDYGLLPELAQKGMRKTIHVLTGRGCNYRCSFCYNSVRNQRWWTRSAEEIVKELEGIVARYNPEKVYFRDETFFHSRERIDKFLQLYKAKGFHFRWQANCRADRFSENYINDELMRKLVETNCQMLKVGMESGSQPVLKKLKKGTSVKQLYKVVDSISGYPSIQPLYSFMIGIPGEEFPDYLKTINLIKYILKKERNPLLIGPQPYRVYPGGELFNEVVEKYHISLPGSFEEWSRQYFPQRKEVIFGEDFKNYPWVAKKNHNLVNYCHYLFYFGYVSLKKKSFWLKLAFVPFRILARIRLSIGFYSFLYDFRLASWLRWLRKRYRNMPW